MMILFAFFRWQLLETDKETRLTKLLSFIRCLKGSRGMWKMCAVVERSLISSHLYSSLVERVYRFKRDSSVNNCLIFISVFVLFNEKKTKRKKVQLATETFFVCCLFFTQIKFNVIATEWKGFNSLRILTVVWCHKLCN